MIDWLSFGLGGVAVILFEIAFVLVAVFCFPDDEEHL